ncbi:MAG: VanZ family protein [Planctomycetota bacterium]
MSVTTPAPKPEPAEPAEHAPASPKSAPADQTSATDVLWGHDDPMAMPAPPRRWCVFVATAYLAALVYGSLLPWSGWSWQAVAAPDATAAQVTWAALQTPASSFTMNTGGVWGGLRDGAKSWAVRPMDAVANALLYVPLGLSVFALWRSFGMRRWPAGLATVAVAAAACWGVESAQSGLPARVPSAADALLNTGGAALGVILAAGLAQALCPLWTRWKVRFGRLRTTAALWRRRPTGVATLLLLGSATAVAGVLTLTAGRMHGPFEGMEQAPLTWLFEGDYGEGLARLALLGVLATGSGVLIALAFARRERGGLWAAALWAGSWALAAEACRAALSMDRIDAVAPAAVAAAAALAVTPLRWAARAIPPRCRRQGRTAPNDDERRAGTAA